MPASGLAPSEHHRGAGPVRKVAGAVDYADIDELAEDAEGPPLQPLSFKLVFATPVASSSGGGGGGQKAQLPPLPSLDELRRRFPQFERNKVLRFTELFAAPTRPHLSAPATAPVPAPQPTTMATPVAQQQQQQQQYEIDADTVTELSSALPPAAVSLATLSRRTAVLRRAWKAALEAQMRGGAVGPSSSNSDSSGSVDGRVPVFRARDDPDVLSVSLHHWEDNIVWDDRSAAALQGVRAPRINPNTYMSWSIETIPWENVVLLGDGDDNSDDNESDIGHQANLDGHHHHLMLVDQRVPVVVDLNDPNMIFEMDKHSAGFLD